MNKLPGPCDRCLKRPARMSLQAPERCTVISCGKAGLLRCSGSDSSFRWIWQIMCLLRPAFYMKTYALYVTLVLFFACVSVAEIPENDSMYIIENMPFHPQESYQCGPAALSMVLNYWGIAVSPEEIAKEIFSETARGTLNIDMLLFSQRKGMTAVQYRGNIDDLKKNIRSGYPVIVLVDYGFSLYKKHHYMVVYGYSEKGLIINSGRSEKQYMKQETFLNLWGKTEYWTLLVRPEESR